MRQGPQTRGAPQAPSGWGDLGVTTQLYVASVSAIGLAVIAWALPIVAGPERVPLGVLVCLSIPVSLVKVRLPRVAATLTLSHVLNYVALLTLGTHAAVLVAVGGAWSQCSWRSGQDNAVHRRVFSIAGIALATQVAGVVYVFMVSTPGTLNGSASVVPLIGAATSFFLINSWLVAGAIALSTNRPVGTLWCETFLPTWPAFLLGATVAGANLLAVQHQRWWVVVLLLIPFALSFHNLRTYLERDAEAVTDALTGLANQRYIVAHATRELDRAKRRGTSLALIIVDLDGFKGINDTYGHRAGDAALRRVARCLKESLRSYDVCARYGGDEFLAVLPDCSAAEGEAKSRDLQRAVEGPDADRPSGATARLSISVGCAAYPDDDTSLEGLLEIADTRMYRNKQARGGRPNHPPAVHGAPHASHFGLAQSETVDRRGAESRSLPRLAGLSARAASRPLPRRS